MSLTFKKVFAGAALLSIGQATGYALSFVRNLILARMLTKADFGLAAALSMAMSLLELVSRMGFGRQIVQAPEGDEPAYQDVAHAVQAWTGLISASLVLAFAYPMAVAFHHSELTWAFACMAFVPFFRGFLHLDLARVQRHLHYRPQVIAEFVPQAASTLAAWPLALLFRDFRAVLFTLVAKEFLTFILSHLLAERPYRWGWNRERFKLMWAFGWPLLLNGFVMFGAQQGDQMLIGGVFSLEELAVYSVAYTLCSIPFAVFGQVSASLMLPVLARKQDDPVSFASNYRLCLQASVLAAMLLVIPLIVGGEAIVRLLYGPKYYDAGHLIAVFGAVAALHFFRLAPAIAAMSKADTTNLLLGNVARACSLLLALGFVVMGSSSIIQIAACGIVGEVLALLVTIYLVHVRFGIEYAAHFPAGIFLAIWLLLAVFLNLGLGTGFPIWAQLTGTMLLLGAGGFAAAFFFPGLMGVAEKAYRSWLPFPSCLSFISGKRRKRAELSGANN